MVGGVGSHKAGQGVRGSDLYRRARQKNLWSSKSRSHAREEKKVVGDGRWRGRLTIGIVIRVNDTAGGVEVGESALIGAVEGC